MKNVLRLVVLMGWLWLLLPINQQLTMAFEWVWPWIAPVTALGCVVTIVVIFYQSIPGRTWPRMYKRLRKQLRPRAKRPVLKPSVVA